MRIVEVEAYLDAKSDDTVMCERRKKDTLVSLPKALLWYAESHDGKKKEKTVGSYSPKKLLVRDHVSVQRVREVDDSSRD